MTHLHIPDGILPLWLWVSGLVVMTLVLAFSLFRLRRMDMKVKIPLLGALSATMLVAMTLEILPLAYHINLSLISGILLGPALGFVAAFIVNLILAFMGHGGITVMGLNTLLLGSEAALGHMFFYLLMKRLPLFWRAGTATVLALMTSTIALIGIVAASNLAPALFAHGGEQAHEYAGHVSVPLFATLALSLGSIGWLIEAAITGSIVTFLSKVKPELLAHRLHKNMNAGGGQG